MSTKQELQQIIREQKEYIQQLEGYILQSHSHLFASMQAFALNRHSSLPLLRPAPPQSETEAENTDAQETAPTTQKPSEEPEEHVVSITPTKNKIHPTKEIQQQTPSSSSNVAAKSKQRRRRKSTLISDEDLEEEDASLAPTPPEPREPPQTNIEYSKTIDIFDMSFWKSEIETLLRKPVLTKTLSSTRSIATGAKKKHDSSSESEDSSDESDESDESSDGDYKQQPKRSPKQQTEMPKFTRKPEAQAQKKRKIETEGGTKSKAIAPAKDTEPRKRKMKQLAAEDKPESKKKQTWLRMVGEVNEKFAKFLGQTQITRAEAYKKVWEYIKKHNLQKDTTDKKKIYCDATLKELLSPTVNPIPNMWSLNKLILQQFTSTKVVQPPAPSASSSAVLSTAKITTPSVIGALVGEKP